MSERRLAGATTLSEANDVLADFLPRFNQRFGVAAAQPELAYRPLDPELDLAGVLSDFSIGLRCVGVYQGAAQSGQGQHGAI